MACLALQETDQLMFETMAVLLSNKQNKNQNEASYFKFFFHFDCLMFSAFLFPSLLQRFLYNFKANFVLSDEICDL